MSGEQIQLTDSVNDPNAKDLRSKAPELFNNDVTQALPGDANDDAGADAGADEAGADGDAAATGADAEGADGGDKGGDRGKEGGPIPKKRFNEVLEQRDAAKQRAAQLEQERADLVARLEAAEAANKTAAQEQADAAAQRDIRAELEALDDQYDLGDLDVGEYRKQQRVLQRALDKQIEDRASAAAKAVGAAAVQEDRALSNQQQFERARDGFLARPENKMFNDHVPAATALNAAMQEIAAANPTKRFTHEELFEAGRARMVEVGMLAAPAGATDPKKATEEQRARQSAQQNATAALIPPHPAGGRGDRGNADPAIDMTSVSASEWAKLPQARRDELLGKTPK